jgi:chemotaxis protein methyltransferase CheR
MATTGIVMNDTQFEKLRRIIYERSGIHFQESKKYVLESRLSRRLEELEIENFDQYISFLSIGPYRDDEFQEMFNRITINETSFFRNVPQLDIFEKDILGKLIDERRHTKRLRIWSCGCSTGEEPYTLAIQVHRSLGTQLPDWKVEILGTDISEKVLLIAQSGRYTSYSVRGVNPLIMQRYFTQTGGFYQVSPDITSMVRFELLNLKNPTAARRFGTWDVIFCRNVMIYFDDAMRRHCLQVFHNQLNPNGTLFIGHSETLRNVTDIFSPLAMPQGFAYRKAAVAAGRRELGNVA